MTESEYQTLLAAIVEASDVRYDAAKVVLTKLMGESVKPTTLQAIWDWLDTMPDTQDFQVLGEFLSTLEPR